MLGISETGDAIILDWALAVAAMLALLHIAAPHFRGHLKRHSVTVGSLGAGMAVTYVFLHLFPELEVGESVFGKRVHLLVLVGFLVYYGMENSLAARETRFGTEATRRSRFKLELCLGWVYGWLLLYALPDSLKADGLGIVPLLLAMGLHQAHIDFELCEAFEKDFETWGRFALATGPLIGWITDVLYFADDPRVSATCTALLAGSCLYKTFRHQLPESGRSQFGWFLAGVITSAALNFLAGENLFS